MLSWKGYESDIKVGWRLKAGHVGHKASFGPRHQPQPRSKKCAKRAIGWCEGRRLFRKTQGNFIKITLPATQLTVAASRWSKRCLKYDMHKIWHFLLCFVTHLHLCLRIFPLLAMELADAAKEEMNKLLLSAFTEILGGFVSLWSNDNCTHICFLSKTSRKF